MRDGRKGKDLREGDGQQSLDGRILQGGARISSKFHVRAAGLVRMPFTKIATRKRIFVCGSGRGRLR